jgi:hypothetical protein
MSCFNCEWTKNTPADSTDSSWESWRIFASQQFATFQEPEKLHNNSLPNYSHASLNNSDTFGEMHH